MGEDKQQPRSTSPVIVDAEVVKKLITFPEAIAALTVGSWITKQEWKDEEIYCLLRNGFATLRKADGKFYQWIISDGDLTGTDWYILKERE